jgi:hypothetical protein
MTRSFPFRICPERTNLGQVPPAVHGAVANSGKTGRFAPLAQQLRPIGCYVHRPASPRTMSRTRIRVQVHPTAVVVRTTTGIAPLGSRVPRRVSLDYGVSVSREAVRVNADDLISDLPTCLEPIGYSPVLHDITSYTTLSWGKRPCRLSGIVPNRPSGDSTLFSSGQMATHEDLLRETPGRTGPARPSFIRQSVKFVHYAHCGIWDNAA